MVSRIQVEFDPDTVARYRLLGYENRALADAEFRDHRRDAGEVGPGHAVTAVYRLEFRDGPGGPLATARLRWQEPTSGEWKEIERTIGTPDIARSFEAASPSFRRAACAAEFAERLRSESEIPPRLVQLAREVGPEGLAGLVERASNLPRRWPSRRLGQLPASLFQRPGLGFMLPTRTSSGRRWRPCCCA